MRTLSTAQIDLAARLDRETRDLVRVPSFRGGTAPGEERFSSTETRGEVIQRHVGIRRGGVCSDVYYPIGITSRARGDIVKAQAVLDSMEGELWEGRRVEEVESLFRGRMEEAGVSALSRLLSCVGYHTGLPAGEVLAPDRAYSLTAHFRAGGGEAVIRNGNVIDGESRAARLARQRLERSAARVSLLLVASLVEGVYRETSFETVFPHQIDCSNKTCNLEHYLKFLYLSSHCLDEFQASMTCMNAAFKLDLSDLTNCSAKQILTQQFQSPDAPWKANAATHATCCISIESKSRTILHYDVSKWPKDEQQKLVDTKLLHFPEPLQDKIWPTLIWPDLSSESATLHLQVVKSPENVVIHAPDPRFILVAAWSEGNA